jgi:hypothetical protein
MSYNVLAVYDVLPARIRACGARPGLAKCGGENGTKDVGPAAVANPRFGVNRHIRRIGGVHRHFLYLFSFKKYFYIFINIVYVILI